MARPDVQSRSSSQTAVRLEIRVLKSRVFQGIVCLYRHRVGKVAAALGVVIAAYAIGTMVNSVEDTSQPQPSLIDNAPSSTPHGTRPHITIDADTIVVPLPPSARHQRPTTV
jgi:hypothetical protein